MYTHIPFGYSINSVTRNALSLLDSSRWVLTLLSVLVVIQGCTREVERVEFAEEIHTVQETMYFLLEPAADEIWDNAGWIITEEETIDLLPTTDEGWFRVIHSAVVIMETGNLLLTPNKRQDDQDWVELSKGLITVGEQIKQSALDRDGKRLFDLGGHLYNVCVACHQNYWLDRPVRPSDQ